MSLTERILGPIAAWIVAVISAGGYGGVALLMAIFPISKLMHAPGLLFSPTRNQADTARERRHLAPWAARLEQRP